jgi:Leucine-rich repeat (LRR) protein
VHLHGLTKLKSLFLNSTHVGDDGLVNLQSLPNLDTLHLNGTQVGNGAGLARLKRLTNLAHLNLAGTQVRDAGLDHVKHLTNLTQLNLADTRVSDAGLQHLLHLGKLSFLDLQRTRVSAKGMASLRAAFPASVAFRWSEPNREAALAVLALGGTVHFQPETGKQDQPASAPSDLPSEYFRLTRANLAGVRKSLGGLLPKLEALVDPTFDGLVWLDLSGTSLTAADIRHLGPLTSLTELSLARTQVGDGLACLKKLTGLRRLVLDGAPIRGPELQHLKDLPVLTELRLSCPTLTDLGVCQLAHLRRLERLSLAGSGVTDAGLKHLHVLTALKQLDLTDTKVRAAAVTTLQNALPKCHISSGEKAR